MRWSHAECALREPSVYASTSISSVASFSQDVSRGLGAPVRDQVLGCRKTYIDDPPMQVLGQERHDNVRLEAGDTEPIGCLPTPPVLQQRLRQSDSVVVLEPTGLLVCATSACATIYGSPGICEDATRAGKMRIMEPDARVRVEISEEEVDNE
jgi:hypothetical protein